MCDTVIVGTQAVGTSRQCFSEAVSGGNHFRQSGGSGRGDCHEGCGEGGKREGGGVEGERERVRWREEESEEVVTSVFLTPPASIGRSSLCQTLGLPRPPSLFLLPLQPLWLETQVAGHYDTI